ncbi:hypothetical protein AB0I22_34905 [Streptomyces sp. NPDC050610]|uniref:hypothetical protein n=1 Tax=Streptomyces sp. NPDC050610 TaxID=3157097 RepID=UPI00343F7BC5
MPLPFLTAERDYDEIAAAVPLPFEDRDRWRRPYRPGPWRVGGSALLLLLASYILLCAVVIAAAGSLVGAGVCLGVAVLIIAFSVQLVRVGIWVSAQGLRQVGLFSSLTVRWQDVASVRTVQQPVRWLGLPRTVQGQALIVGRRTGEPVRTVLTDHNGDFLSRAEAFDMAADAIEGWAAEYSGRP